MIVRRRARLCYFFFDAKCKTSNCFFIKTTRFRLRLPTNNNAIFHSETIEHFSFRDETEFRVK